MHNNERRFVLRWMVMVARGLGCVANVSWFFSSEWIIWNLLNKKNKWELIRKVSFFYRHRIIKNLEYFILGFETDRLFSPIIPRSRGKYRLESFPNTLRRNDSTRYRSFIKLHVHCRVHSVTKREKEREKDSHLALLDDGDDLGILCLQPEFLESKSCNVSREILLFSCFLPAKGIEETCRSACGRQFVRQFSRLSNQVSSN